MKKRVLTYGTFDILHKGHINILKGAASLGDELYVGVSSDEFNRIKGKKSFQSFEDRKKVVEELPFVTKVFKEDDWEQKETDIKKFDVDIFTMGSDWEGKFDFLEQKGLCKVKILPRTKGISSTELRNKQVEIALITYSPNLKYLTEAFKSLLEIKQYKNIIVNIYDNGNEDEIVEEEFKKYFHDLNNFNYIKILKNEGKGKLVRDILLNTSSDFVQIMNDDDIIDAKKFSNNITNILGKDFDVSFTNYFYLNDKNKKTKLKKIINGHSDMYDTLPRRAWTLDLNAIYNVDFIRKNVRLSENITNYSDIYINCEILSSAKKIFYLNESHYFYRIKREDKKNVSSTKSIKKNINEFENTFIEMLKIENISENILWRIELMFIAVIMLSDKKITYKKLINKVKQINEPLSQKIKKSLKIRMTFWGGYNPIVWIYKIFN